MIHLGSQAELHKGGAHLLLRTYYSHRSYAYIVQSLNSGLPVALCDERFETSREAMRKAEEVASRFVGSAGVEVEWKPTRSHVSSGERSRIVALPVEPVTSEDESASNLG